MSDIITPSTHGEWEADDVYLTNVEAADIDLAAATADIDLAKSTAEMAMSKATEALRRLDTPLAPTGKRRPASRREVR